MASCKYDWPAPGQREVIGKFTDRIDGPAKVSGRAKYTYDVNSPTLLFAKMLTCPHAHAKVKSVDLSAARAHPGVKAALVIQDVGTEIQWAGDEVAAVAAVDEATAEDALKLIKVEYDVLPHLVREEDLSKAGDRAKPAGEQKVGDPDKAFADPAAVVSEGFYGIPVITHCCLETHGNVVEWRGPASILTHSSTQNVSGVPSQLGAALRAKKVNVQDSNIETICQYIGGGFGSKFSVDRWGVVAAQLSKQAGGMPVKLMLERDEDLEVAGCRPSYFGHVKVAATKDGALTAWHSETWGTGGPGPSGVPPVPYVLTGTPNIYKKHTSVSTNIGPARAWRAPNHPQACLMTLAALDDLAAKLNMDPLEFLKKNVNLAPSYLVKTYQDELDKARELSEWSKYWHPRGDKTPGHIKRGLGVSLHTWGGRGHAGSCNVIVRPDGSVVVESGTQDLGTGTRTVIAVVAAETFGLPVEAIQVEIGDSRFPFDGASGGSTTVGAASAWTRRGSVDALNELFAAVAPPLGAQPGQLEARNGRIQVQGDSSKSLAWKDACAQLGAKNLQTMGKNPGPCNLGSVGVGGVQVADVSVDTETGLVKINRLVAVQDCGLVIDMKTAESQVYGALIMGVCYSLLEEKIMDQTLGRMLNANMEFYKLAGIGDIGGELIVHMMTGPGYDERGVIGLGEPPVISPGAAISNAVANALGVRVPTLPLTPDRILTALAKGGVA
jgi:xanthine dehydrogenase YagR molybdenum-binding subunit